VAAAADEVAAGTFARGVGLRGQESVRVATGGHGFSRVVRAFLFRSALAAEGPFPLAAETQEQNAGSSEADAWR